MAVSAQELRRALELLKGKECWSILAGAGTGSTLHLEFGERVPRRLTLRKRRGITDEQALYEGELDLFVQCAWRLGREDAVLCGSTDDNRIDGPMVGGLETLVGRVVLDVDVAVPVPDLSLRFADYVSLTMFCDQTNVETNQDNYSVRVGETIYVVGTRGVLGREMRSSQ